MLLLPIFSALLGATPSSGLDVQTISVVGSKFFYEDGTQYFLKGVAYQLTPGDPLVDTDQCQRDVARMAELGVNSIRVYHVDPSADHRGCMEVFAEAGIYLFVDLDTFHTQIEQGSPQWTEAQFKEFQAVLDEFQAFPNTAGVFVGNEVITTKEGSAAAPYVLAAARDIKAYRDMKGYRAIPVGYSAADIAELRPMMQDYFACFEDPSERLDFFALNAYEWCGDSSYTVSGYNMLQKNATNYPIPIFFSETGCNTVRPRTFTDQEVIFGDDMAGTWSGSIVYEWIQETNDYGLISYGPPTDEDMTLGLIEDGFTRKGSPTPVSPDFDNLKTQWATLTPSGVRLPEYSTALAAATIPPLQCPEPSLGWQVIASSSLPTLGLAYGKPTTSSTGSSASAYTSSVSRAVPESAAGSVTVYSGSTSAPIASGAENKEVVFAAVLLSCIIGFAATWL